MPTTPLLLTDEMCDPARLTNACPISIPDVRSALATDSRIAAPASSTLTTTPLRIPRAGSIPTPMISKSVSLVISAISVQILVVPTSMAVSNGASMSLQLADRRWQIASYQPVVHHPSSTVYSTAHP